MRKAIDDGRLKGNESLRARVTLTLEDLDVRHEIEGAIELE